MSDQTAELARTIADQAEALAAGRPPVQSAAAARIRDNAEMLRGWLVESDLAGAPNPIEHEQPAAAPVLWELHYERQREGEDPSDFERTVWGPPPIAGMTQPRDAVPADVRHWAQMNGAACHADAVAYALAVLVDVTGYTETGACAALPSVHTIYAEEIR